SDTFSFFLACAFRQSIVFCKWRNIVGNLGKRYLEKPTASQLPDWPRVISAMRDVRERLKKAAVER
ncbi:MAG: hypothetical protein ACQXXJ_04270, partial [Candidatus Bathyarchaeia archaeon]